MNFLKFKNYLIKNKIILFDSHYRLIHYRINNINGQIGGNICKRNIKKLSPYELENFINALLYNNIIKTNYYTEHFKKML